MIQWFSKKLRNRKGFTLVELIVVIAILGILAMIAIPRLGSFRDSADQARRDADERIMISAGQMLIAAEGVTDAAGTYTSTEPGDLGNYVDGWPATVNKVVIEANGNITVTMVTPGD